MNKKVKIGIAVAAIVVIAAVIIVALTLPPSGLSIKSSWTDNTSFGSGTLHYECTIFNHENKTAKSVRLVLMLFDSNNNIIKTETVDVGDIPPLGSEDVSLDIPHSGLLGVGKVDAHLEWTP